ncbi:Spc98 family-domain-containing protein [Syncephalis fuscata]|nr:Spc98 family-domain-containing protein [Syncephalis fuscata]
MAHRLKGLDYFTHQLITLFIGVKRESDEYEQCWTFIKSGLKPTRYFQTDALDYERKYIGLAEKLTAHSQTSKANTLLMLRTRLLELWRPKDTMLPHHVLRLLFDLSQSPSNAIYTPSTVTEEIVTHHQLTWEDILKDDPLTGDHWDKPNYTPDTDTDSESDNDDTVHPSVKQKLAIKQISEPSTTDQLISINLEKQHHQSIREQLVQQQYWRSKPHNPLITEFDFYNASTLTPTLNQMTRKSISWLPFQFENYTIERLVIREVLFMLMGRPCFLFTVQNDIIKVSNQAQMKHLSQGALGSILSLFADSGTVIYGIRSYSLVVLTMETDPKSRVSEAFASAIRDELRQFDQILRQIEYEHLTDHGPVHVKDTLISLLKIRSTLKEQLDCFDRLSNLLGNICTQDSTIYTTSILDQLYNAAEHQSYIGSTNALQFILRLWEKSMLPYLEILHMWLFNGEIQDPDKEFVIERMMEIPLQSSQYWSSAFRLKSIDQCCPAFLRPYIQSIVIIGKMMCLLRQVDTQRLTDDSIEWMSLFRWATKKDEEKTTRLMSKDNDCLLQKMFCSLLPESTKFNEYSTENDKSVITNADVDKPAVNLWMPLSAQLANAIDFLVVKRRGDVGRSLIDQLARRHHLWRSINGLFGFYYMLAGQSWHRFCGALFMKMDSEAMWADRQFINQLLLDAVQGDVQLDDRCISAWIRTTDEGTLEQSICSLQVLDFDYSIPWPLNNIIRSTTLNMYRKITNLLLQVRRARYLMEQPEYFKLPFKRQDATSGLFYALRMRLLAFTYGFYNYLMTTVLHAESQRFLKEIKQLADIDAMIQLHERHILLVRDRCLLNEKVTIILRSVVSLLESCQQLRQLFQQYVKIKDRTLESTPGFHQALVTLANEFERTRAFVETSLRVIARAGGFQHLEVLASLIAN